jgi:hypothetical protein
MALVRDALAARIAAGSRVVVVGTRGPDASDALRACGCDVMIVAHPHAVREAAPFDAALVTEFDERWGHPSVFLRELRSSLGRAGRLLISHAGTGAAAVRITVYGESNGEAVAPVMRELDLDRFATRALAELLASSGYRVLAGTPSDGWIEGAAIDREMPGEASTVRVAAGDDRLALAEAELRDLRAFVQTVLERQRRLHEELARLRGSVAQREAALVTLRAQLDEAFGAAALAQERLLQLGAAELQLAAAEARIADLDARRIRLSSAVVELRER